jgi:homoserine O-acetyltransferase
MLGAGVNEVEGDSVVKSVLSMVALALALASAMPCCMPYALAAQPGTKQQLAQEKKITTALSPREGNFVARDFRFHDGETLAKLRLHYLTLGEPHRGPDGRVDNAILILHGTGGSGRQFMNPVFAGVLFGSGQPLDAAKYYIILPDDIGHGHSSKPSDGRGMAFPHYDYADMVAAEHLLVTKGLHVDHLRLVMGTSMGCMHSFMWGEDYPQFMDALLPLACQPVAIGGRNRLWRDSLMDAIRDDPVWNKGDYATEPLAGLRGAARLLLIVGGAPLRMQQKMPTGADVDEFLKRVVPRIAGHMDANDTLYQFDSSRDYDPSQELGKIQAPLTWINSADDFINPPMLGIARREIRKIPHGKFILIPASLSTFGHGTHTHAAIWKRYLVDLLARSQHQASPSSGGRKP